MPATRSRKAPALRGSSPKPLPGQRELFDLTRAIDALSPLEKTALFIAGKTASKVRDDLPPGHHPIDITLRLTGDVYVGEDQNMPEERTPKPRVLLAAILAHLDSDARMALARKLKRHFAKFVESGTEPLTHPRTEPLVDTFLATLTHHTTKPVRGNVTGKIDAEKVKAPLPSARLPRRK